jgi:hypothetical protein
LSSFVLTVVDVVVHVTPVSTLYDFLLAAFH